MCGMVRKVVIKDPSPSDTRVISNRAFYTYLLVSLNETGSIFVSNMTRYQAYRFVKRAKKELGANVVCFPSEHFDNGESMFGYWFRVIL